MHTNQVQPSEFLTNLGPTEFIAVNPAGQVVSRASTRAAVEHATKNSPEVVEIFSGTDLALKPVAPAPLQTTVTLDKPLKAPPNPISAGIGQANPILNKDSAFSPSTTKASFETRNED